MMKRSDGSGWRRVRTGLTGGIALLVLFGLGSLRAHAACVGDCGGTGEVTVNELIIMINIALGTENVQMCPGADPDADGKVTVNEIILGVNNLLNACPSEASPTPTPSMTDTPTDTPTATATAQGVLSIAEAAARDADGIALRLGQTVTTEGVVTVAAGLLANNKLKIFIQDGNAGIMVYHQTSADVEAFQPGQRLRVTGVIRQQDPAPDNNPATGTVAVDITQGVWTVLSNDNPIPDPQPVTLAVLNASGTLYTGSLVRVQGVQKIAGNWPTVGSQSTQVTISDDGGTTTLVLRLQRFTITSQLVQALNAIGNGTFTLTGIVVQNDTTNDGKLLSGFEIWERGAQDVVGP
jgi:hypothetical protein